MKVEVKNFTNLFSSMMTNAFLDDLSIEITIYTFQQLGFKGFVQIFVVFFKIQIV